MTINKKLLNEFKKEKKYTTFCLSEKTLDDLLINFGKWLEKKKTAEIAVKMSGTKKMYSEANANLL